MATPVTLSDAELEVLKAIVDTFIASIKLTDAKLEELSNKHRVHKEVLRTFFAQKGSDIGTHLVVVKKLQNYVRPEDATALKGLFGAMGTSAGCFALTGYFAPFPKLSLAEREIALRSWADSSFELIRKIFSSLKSLIGLTYFAAAEEFQNQSIAWKAIQYPGPPAELFEAARQPQFEFKFEDPFAANSQGILEYDVVIVGSGCGGGVAAAVIAKSGAKVLVLEKANYFKRAEYKLTEESAFHNLYENGAAIATTDTGLSILAGSSFGGGSQINWSASFRTPDHVRKEWAETHKLPVFTSKRFDDALDAVCNRLGVHTDVSHNPPNATIVEGCTKLGYDVSDIPHNAPGHHSCGWCTFGCTRGLKQGMQETFLQDAAKAGAHFIVNASVLRVNHKAGKASGVVAEYKNPATGVVKKFEVKAKVVVVSAGTLNTPLVLKRSGLKDPNIGKYLRLHPVVAVRGRFDKEMKPWDGCNMSAVSKVTANRNGTHYGSIIETPILHAGLLGSGLPWRAAEDYKTSCLDYKNTVFLIVIARDTGHGTVDLDKDGKMVTTYPLNKFDHDSLIEGSFAAVKILVASGAKEIQSGVPQLPVLRPSSTDVNAPDVQQYLSQLKASGLPIGKAPLFCAHQMGSCRLGNDKGAASVLNPEGESWEIKNLFVADASTFPTPSGVNPMITTESVSYLIAQNVVERLKQLAKPAAAAAFKSSSVAARL